VGAEIADLVHLQTGISFHAPVQIGAAPRSQPMAACCVPEKSYEFTHVVLSLNKGPDLPLPDPDFFTNFQFADDPYTDRSFPIV
jgi:hypothetical protein